MSSQGSVPQRTHRGQPDKHRAIAQAARAVFGQKGYSGASVDMIAAEAGVSKRTIYNHYQDKEQLFLSVILEGSAEVAETHTRIADRHLRKILDLEEDLVAFALEWASSPTAFAGHFALVRTIQAEAARIPPAVLEAWQDTGPRAFKQELARYMSQMADHGLLAFDDADTAALHFYLLTFVSVAQRSFYGAIPIGEAEITQLVVGGVKAFLRLYRPDSGERETSDRVRRGWVLR
ncbi:TetR/AcrR family transcriptional regulator [Streptomyces sp. NPDC020996]|uniref:TetR/AcrR family transcriptional regulator n=1 Tax=Streptomyces sp. NPDC020996 TaxID=3154791 RepID=UPI0033C41430